MIDGNPPIWPVGMTRVAISPEDGKRRYVNAQRIGRYPLFIETGLLQRSLIDEWLATMWLPGFVALASQYCPASQVLIGIHLV